MPEPLILYPVEEPVVCIGADDAIPGHAVRFLEADHGLFCLCAKGAINGQIISPADQHPLKGFHIVAGITNL